MSKKRKKERIDIKGIEIDEKNNSIEIEEIDIEDKKKKIRLKDIEIRENKRSQKFKKFWKKFWFVVWKDDSFKGWIVSVIFLFIVIKLIFFPVLNFATGTSLPLVIVESCSMYHEGNLFSNFDNWWDENNLKYMTRYITKDNFEGFTMKSGFNKGDILFVIGIKPEKIKVGDIIIFEADYQYPIIHRVMKIENENGELIFSTMGDNNSGQLETEKRISQDRIIGKAIAKPAPYIGWIKLIFFEHSKPASQRGFCQ